MTFDSVRSAVGFRSAGGTYKRCVTSFVPRVTFAQRWPVSRPECARPECGGPRATVLPLAETSLSSLSSSLLVSPDASYLGVSPWRPAARLHLPQGPELPVSPRWILGVLRGETRLAPGLQGKGEMGSVAPTGQRRSRRQPLR